MKLVRRISCIYRIPRGWGVLYRDHARYEFVLMPVPLNVICSAALSIYRAMVYIDEDHWRRDLALEYHKGFEAGTLAPVPADHFRRCKIDELPTLDECETKAVPAADPSPSEAVDSDDA